MFKILCVFVVLVFSHSVLADRSSCLRRDGSSITSKEMYKGMKLLHVNPELPNEEGPLDGTLEMTLTIHRGKVIDIKELSSDFSEEYSAKVLAAAKLWAYAPYCQDGISVKYEHNEVFKLNRREN